MPNSPEVRGLTVVLVGDFNPMIFQPRWFSEESLLTVEEADTATVNIIHPDVTMFGLPWINLTIQRERFQAQCLAQPYFEKVVGLVARTFELLRHTPVRMMGINNEAHYRASSIDKWHAFGHKLAPKTLWTEFFPSPGLQDLTIRQAPRTDGNSGHIQITIQPSVRIIPGVYMAVNDHYVVATPQDPPGATKAVDLLGARWSEANTFSEGVFSRLAEEI